MSFTSSVEKRKSKWGILVKGKSNLVFKYRRSGWDLNVVPFLLEDALKANGATYSKIEEAALRCRRWC
jgi:hypothetical protein